MRLHLEAGGKAFRAANATVTLVNPVVSARADATFGGRATADWYINAEDIGHWQMLQESLLIRQKLPEQMRRKQQIRTNHLIRQQIRPERTQRTEGTKNK
ncbi:MAG: DUF961 family protein [Roseburia intestinalis]